MATELHIHLHPVGGPDLTTSDAETVAALHHVLGPEADHLVVAHDFAGQLRTAGRHMWADTLDRLDEAHMVRVVFSS